MPRRARRYRSPSPTTSHPLSKVLYEHGADVDQRTNGGVTALMIAVEVDSQEMVDLLLDLGAKMHDLYEHTQQSLFDIAIDNSYLDLAKWLVRRGCFRPEIAEGATRPAAEAGDESLVMLAYNGDAERVRSTIQAMGPSLSRSDLQEALHVASAQGHLSVAKLLLGRRIAVNSRDITGRTALHYATRLLHEDVAELLMESGASVSLEDEIGSTPIDLAVVHGMKSASFIEKHMAEFTFNISRRPSLLETPNQLSNLSVMAARRAISGTWSGKYEHISWMASRSDPFTLHIPAEPAPGQQPCTFSGER